MVILINSVVSLDSYYMVDGVWNVQRWLTILRIQPLPFYPQTECNNVYLFAFIQRDVHAFVGQSGKHGEVKEDTQRQGES